MDKGKARQLDAETVPPRDRLQDSPLTYNQLVSGIIDFLEVAFHTILCMRSVYPYDVFARRKKYSHPCYQSRHPGLNEYISRVLTALRGEIEKSTISKVILVIRPNVVVEPAGFAGSGSSVGVSSSDGGAGNPADAYERFVFSLDYILPSTLIDPRDRDLAISSNVTSSELEMIFRGFMQKLMVVDGILYDMPLAPGAKGNDGDATAAELTFAVVLEMADEDTSPSGKDRNEATTGDWIPADAENLGRTHRKDTRAADNGHAADSTPKIRPIKTLDSGVINLMLYVEEDIYAKSGKTRPPRSSPSKRNTVRPTSAQPTRTHGVEDDLLHSKATQIDVSSVTAAAGNARELKNRARRLDAERDLDQPALAEAEAEPDIAQAKSKRKRARMVLGETRAAESASESSESAPSSPSGSSQSVRDDFGGQLSGGF
ncbi:DNA-binding HORMA [Kalmanozyma brasiliensis GHG001]|uniref:HORMA domain-containing protein n=1 Tax=Kalmanozyma brasiliensis (strain GHG001) TaxID=1365824 RepID=V5ERE7_KALBG|nr:DNA-binding HORMA [Kalmanozyma brasiliensis GHG001]EST07700.1 DNA-binding HORMA [Kalmanozyma brasiliensis GHG001]